MQSWSSLDNDYSSLSSSSRNTVRAFGWLSGSSPSPTLLCPLLTSPRYSAPVTQRPASLFGSTGEISRGKTRYLLRTDAGFTTCTPVAEGGLRGHVPARPGGITPTIRFLFIALRVRMGLPPDPASRRRPGPSPWPSARRPPGVGTGTRLASCHARHTRRSSAAGAAERAPYPGEPESRPRSALRLVGILCIGVIWQRNLL